MTDQARRGIVELHIPAALLHQLTGQASGTAARQAAAWQPVLTSIAAHYPTKRPIPSPDPGQDIDPIARPLPDDPETVHGPDDGAAGLAPADPADALEWIPALLPDHLLIPDDPVGGPIPGHPDPHRYPGASLRRHTEIRDRSCYLPTCRVPATRADKDHLTDHTHGGRTTSGGLGNGCRHDHRARHAAAIHHCPATADTDPDLWITGRTGHLLPAHRPRIIDPLPDPIPRDHDPWVLDEPGTDPIDDDDQRAWRQPATRAPPATPKAAPATSGPAPAGQLADDEPGEIADQAAGPVPPF